MNKTIAVLAAVGMTVIFSGPVNADAIKEGQWDMTLRMQMPGMEDKMAQAQKEMDNMSDEDKAMMKQMMGGMGMNMGGGGMAINLSQCITNANPFPERDEEKDCKHNYTRNGNKVNFEVVCADSKSTGEITYKNNSMNGVIKTEAKNGDMTTNISGQYAGPCRPQVNKTIAKKAQLELPNEGDVNEDQEEETTGSKAKKAFGGLKAFLGR